VEAGCVDALAVPLLNISSNSELVLAEVCAAMAVLASEGVCGWVCSTELWQCYILMCYHYELRDHYFYICV